MEVAAAKLIGAGLAVIGLSGVGIGLGVALEPAFQAAVSARMPGFAFDRSTLLLGAGLALGIGLVSGIVPGLRAARLTTVAALREVG